MHHHSATVWRNVEEPCCVQYPHFLSFSIILTLFSIFCSTSHTFFFKIIYLIVIPRWLVITQLASFLLNTQPLGPEMMEPWHQPLIPDYSAAGHQEWGASKPPNHWKVTDAIVFQMLPHQCIEMHRWFLKKKKLAGTDCDLRVPFLRLVTYKINHLPPKCSLTYIHTLTHTMQPSSTGMPLDMVLACSNHASWNCGLLAFGLPSASNKLSQPDPSDVPFHSEKQRARREAERVSGRYKTRASKNEPDS